MATNKSMKTTITIMLMITIAMALYSTVPCDAGRYKPPRPNVCPACVCCNPAPPGVCCGCCAVPVPEPPTSGGYVVAPQDQHAP
ncbi:hypothetical protein vseg_001527 [Gypsophila vaccaria]